MVIVGEKEMESGSISIRKHGGVDLGSMSPEAFKELLIKEVTV